MLGEFLLGFHDDRSFFAKIAADLDHAVVAQKAPDLADNERDGIGGESRAELQIEALGGFQHTDRTDLHEILVFRASADETACNGLDQSHILRDQLIHCFSVALLGGFDQIEIVTDFLIFHAFRHNFFRFVWLLSSETDRSRKNRIVVSEVMYFLSKERRACVSR